MSIEFLENLRYKESESEVINCHFDYKNYTLHFRRYVSTLFPLNEVPEQVIYSINSFEEYCGYADDRFQEMLDRVIFEVKRLDEKNDDEDEDEEE